MQRIGGNCTTLMQQKGTLQGFYAEGLIDRKRPVFSPPYFLTVWPIRTTLIIAPADALPLGVSLPICPNWMNLAPWVMN